MLLSRTLGPAASSEILFPNRSCDRLENEDLTGREALPSLYRQLPVRGPNAGSKGAPHIF